MRDRYADYLKYTPVVKKVELIEERHISETVTETITEWEGRAEIPTLVRHIIKPRMIRWRVHTLWNMEHWNCDWRMETFYFKEIFECRGTITFNEKEEGRTEIILAAVFHIDVPILGHAAEKFIVRNYLSRNLMLNRKAINRLLVE
ncbi:MAG: DUF2505 family protein [bacterium]